MKKLKHWEIKPDDTDEEHYCFIIDNRDISLSIIQDCEEHLYITLATTSMIDREASINFKIDKEARDKIVRVLDKLIFASDDDNEDRCLGL